jgi:putative aminopeptidase FrvX
VPLPDLLRELLTTPGPSGHERGPAAAWRRAAEPFAEVTSDALGSSTARVKGAADGPSLAIVGHIDEIGLAVTHIDDKGFIYFRGIGGWLPEVLLSQRVEVMTKEGRIPGVIGKKRSSFKRDKDEKIEMKDLFIDIGARDGEEARSVVQLGDGVVLAPQPVELRNNRVASRAFDNRVGCYVALETARRVAEGGGPPGDVVAVAAIGEEVGDFAGARTTAFAVRPDIAIAVDVTWSRDIPEGEVEEMGDVRIAQGPTLARGAPLSERIFDLLCETAGTESIEFGIEVVRGSTHTDADAYHLSRAGIATGLVSIPTRYLHTPTELVSLDDVENSVRLLVAFAQRLGSADLAPS